MGKIERLGSLSRAIDHQVRLKMLKVSLENNPQVLFDLKIFVEGDRECIGSANLKGLSMKQILNMFNSLLATNEKIINELKPVIMGHISDKEE